MAAVSVLPSALRSPRRGETLRAMCNKRKVPPEIINSLFESGQSRQKPVNSLADSSNLFETLAACRTELFHILGIVENGRFRLPWRFDLAALAPVDPATGLYL